MRLLPLFLVLTACDPHGADNPRPRPEPIIQQPQPAMTECQIGPWMGIINYSKNMPLHPTKGPPGEFYLDFGEGAEPHYVTCPVSGLGGKTKIVGRFRVEGDPGVVIHGADCVSPSRLAFYFQVADVNWSQNGYRWWQIPQLRSPSLEVGSEFTLEASLEPSQWKTVMANAVDMLSVFAADKVHASRYGFTFGGCGSAGHGADATGKVRLVVLQLEAR